MLLIYDKSEKILVYIRKTTGNPMSRGECGVVVVKS